MNIGIVLAAGKSSRFLSQTPKQLYKLDNKPIISHSVDVIRSKVSETIIVTNSDCYKEIKKIFRKISDIDVVKNDIDCRLVSIKTAINHIDSASNVIIHDAARPFVTLEHIDILLESSKTYLCSQFYFKLVNGLIKKGEFGEEIADRNQYKELVTPQIIDYRLARDLFQGKIDKKFCEVIPLLETLKIRYNLIEATRQLRKITILDDLR
jgi:2-C-methyl-D-erythritol 4-phosphate cytidylyltransferase